MLLKMPDAELNALCDVYQEERLIDRGVLLESFLAHPEPILMHFHLPMRHPQRGAADPLQCDDAGTEIRNGQLCEKLRHGHMRDRPTTFAQRLFGRFRRVRP